MEISTQFGYLAKKIDIKSTNWKITTLKDTFEYNQLKNNYPNIVNGWIYPPIKNIVKNGKKHPLKPVPWVNYLGCSHKIEISNLSFTETDINLLILFFGYLNGLHLLPTGWGYLQKTALKPGELVVFICQENEMVWLIDKAIELIKNEPEEIKNNIYAMLNWYLIAQAYEKEYERFEGQYKVLDVSYKIAKDKRIVNSDSHTGRIDELCKAYNLIVPDWGIVKNRKSILSEMRNKLIHEALYADKPIGIKFPEKQLSYDLTQFNEILILRTFGIGNDIFKAPTKIMRMPYLLELKI